MQAHTSGDREPLIWPAKCEVIGGFPLGPDGRCHTTFTHNPSSLRLSSVDPNLQNIPRPGGLGRMVKEVFCCNEGYTFWARDFSGIEAVLVGYFAGSRDYTRLARLGVHAFFASHICGRPADLSWSDGDLSAYFKEIKSSVGSLYDVAKRCIHASNYMTTPYKMFMEYPETFKDTKDAARYQDMYFDLFPAIREWHKETCLRVDGARRRERLLDERVDPWTLGVCSVTNPFGYVHRFYNVLDWERVRSSERPDGEWIWSYGEDAKRLISNLPQSTAAAIIKRACKSIYYLHPQVGNTMRLLIHDEIFGECRERELERCLIASREVMEAGWPQLPLDPAWGMGEFLSIRTEAKAGPIWADMKTIHES